MELECVKDRNGNALSVPLAVRLNQDLCVCSVHQLAGGWKTQCKFISLGFSLHFSELS